MFYIASEQHFASEKDSLYMITFVLTSLENLGVCHTQNVVLRNTPTLRYGGWYITSTVLFSPVLVLRFQGTKGQSFTSLQAKMIVSKSTSCVIISRFLIVLKCLKLGCKIIETHNADLLQLNPSLPNSAILHKTKSYHVL